MTPQETVMLARYVKACCPQQQIDEFTPDAWHDLLGDLELADCRAAVVAVARRQPFVAPAEIRAEVRRVREERIAARPLPAPPADVSEAEYRTRLKEIIHRAGDGQTPFKAIEAGGGAEPPATYRAERAHIEPPTRGDRQRAETAEQTRDRLLSDAYGYLIAIDDDARTRAIDAAHAQLGQDAERSDVVMLAARLADAKPLPPSRPDKATADMLAATGCPYGCPLGGHDPACLYARPA